MTETVDEYGWYVTTHAPDSSLPEGFPTPILRKRARDSYTHVGAGGWDRYMPPEDCAVPPDMDWTEAHKILVLAAYNQKWARFLDDKQTYEVAWPPEAYLTTDGYVGHGYVGGCVEHHDLDCDDCDEFTEVHGDVQPAAWSWSATIETYEREGNSGSLEDRERFPFLSTLMDPRDVDYQG